LKACDTMRTVPSALPKKMLSEPATMAVMFPTCVVSARVHAPGTSSYLGQE
jgi:hypothetical protein